MTAPDKIWVNTDDNTDGCCPVKTDLDDVGKFFDVGQAVEYTRSDLIAASAVAVPAVVARGVVRDTTDPTGRTMYVLFDRAMSDDEMRDWHDQINALHPTNPLGAVMEVPEVRALLEALRDMRRQFSPYPSEDTERWREEHEACERADAALAAIKEPKP